VKNINEFFPAGAAEPLKDYDLIGRTEVEQNSA